MNNIGSTFPNLHRHFPCCKYLRVSYSCKHKVETKNKIVAKKELCLIGKTHTSATSYSSNMWLKFKDTEQNFWLPLKRLPRKSSSEISIDCLTKCLKVLVACFETNTCLSFLVIGKHWRFLKIWSIKCIHIPLNTSNENLELLAELQCISLRSILALWCSGYHYCTTSFNEAWTKVLHSFKSCSRLVRDSRWWRFLSMVPSGNKAKRLLPVNHTIVHHLAFTLLFSLLSFTLFLFFLFFFFFSRY